MATRRPTRRERDAERDRDTQGDPEPDRAGMAALPEKTVNRWVLQFYFHRAIEAYRSGRNRDFRQFRDIMQGARDRAGGGRAGPGAAAPRAGCSPDQPFVPQRCSCGRWTGSRTWPRCSASCSCCRGSRRARTLVGARPLLRALRSPGTARSPLLLPLSCLRVPAPPGAVSRHRAGPWARAVRVPAGEGWLLLCVWGAERSIRRWQTHRPGDSSLPQGFQNAALAQDWAPGTASGAAS